MTLVLIKIPLTLRPEESINLIFFFTVFDTGRQTVVLFCIQDMSLGSWFHLLFVFHSSLVIGFDLWLCWLINETDSNEWKRKNWLLLKKRWDDWDNDKQGPVYTSVHYSHIHSNEVAIKNLVFTTFQLHINEHTVIEIREPEVPEYWQIFHKTGRKLSP